MFIKYKFIPVMIILLIFTSFTYGCIKEGQQAQDQQSSEQETTSALHNRVIIENSTFNPTVLEINSGETVTWINRDSVPHQIKSDFFNSEKLNTDDTVIFTFVSPGIYQYSCGIHPLMKGKIIVK